MVKTYRYDSEKGRLVSENEALARELIMLLPNFLKLLYRLMKDKRVPSKNKMLLGIATFYVVSPLDLVLDSVPLLGYVDDLFIIAIVIKGLFDAVDEQVLIEHWDGQQELLHAINSILGIAVKILPRDTYEKIRKRFM